MARVERNRKRNLTKPPSEPIFITMISTIVLVNDLRPADVIIARRKGINLVDHYVVYMGHDDSGHWFMANLLGRGVQWYNEDKVSELIDRYTPTEVAYFEGTENERTNALQRAARSVGRSYNLLTFNCEHFANWVQYGESYSDQVETAKQIGKTVAGVALLIIAVRALAKNA